MSLVDLVKSPLKRLKPHRGLFINVDVWSAAHEYHRQQQRLHSLSMHQPGVAGGLEVLANTPPDDSVVVDRGIAVDSEGHMILFPEPERYHLSADQPGVVYLVLRYDDATTEADGAAGEEYQPHYAVERGVVEVRGQLPAEAYVELARVEVSGTRGFITEPQDPVSPRPDEIDYRHRMVSGPRPLDVIGIGLMDLESGPNGQPHHLPGVIQLVQAINATTRYRAEFKGTFDLRQEVAGCHVLVAAGQQSFSFADDQLRVLSRFLERKGVIWAESCGAGLERINEAAPFLHSVEQFARGTGGSLELVDRGHPLLRAHHLFAQPPEGIEGAAQILFSDGIIYTNGDYGCLWNGGRPEMAASRPDIRSAVELGVNLGVYCSRRVHAPLA